MAQGSETMLAEIARGAHLAFQNADELYNEAQLLGTNGRFGRAVFLHQISMEECSKVDMLGAAGIQLVLNGTLDLSKLARSMTRHEVKNRNNAYLGVPVTQAEHEARQTSNAASAWQIFDKAQRDFHKELNDQKNGSLYVDYNNGRFVAPSERITETLAVRAQELNAFFLNHAALHTKALRRLREDRAAMELRLRTLQGSLEQLKHSPSANFEKQIRSTIDQWLRETSDG